MNKIELERQTKEFSLILIRFLESLPKNHLGEALGRQLLKSGTSIGANYREANRAESKADFIHCGESSFANPLLAGIDTGRRNRGKSGGL
jgi:four helix bundle protein